jgi:hypothetical protein
MYLNNQKFSQKDKVKNEVVPVISKSLTLLSYIAYCSDEETTKILFDFLLDDIDEDLSFTFISESIFNTFKNFCINHPTNLIKFKAFESLGYYWIKFPQKLPYSKDIIESVFKSLTTQEEKLLVLKTFNFIFSSLYKKTQVSNNTFDFGTVHLFFEGFMAEILNYLVTESNMLIRHQSITLIKITMEMGNLNAHNLLPYIFSSLFDYNTEIRFVAVYILEKIIKISKDKFLSSIKECLKLSFNLNKNIYIDPRYINSQVKEIDDTADDVRFEVKNENIFELFKYKIGKSIKDDSLNKKMLLKFIQTFQDIKTLDNLQSSSEGFKKFEFFEYVGILIADFKFTHNHEISAVFTSLYKDFNTNFLVFQTKLKEFKQNYSEDCLARLLLLFLTSSLKLALFKFLAAKYDDIDGLQNSLKRGLDFDNFQGENKVSISKDMRNFRFYEFYNCFTLYYKKIYKLSINSQKNKAHLLEYFKKLKKFEKLKTSEIREIVSKYRKKQSKLSEDKLQTFLSSLLFPEKEGDGEGTNKPTFTEKIVNKNRKRVTLDEKENTKYHTNKKDKRKKN